MNDHVAEPFRSILNGHFGAAMKTAHTLSFDPGTLTVFTEGYGEQNGDGELVVDESSIDLLPYDDRDGNYISLKIAHSELIALRDFLTARFPDK